MDKLKNLLTFVKGQASFHEKMATRTSFDSKRQSLHATLAAQFRELLGAMEEAVAKLDAIPKPLPPESNPLELNPEDLTGLPEELLAQLNVTESDKLDGTVVETINAAGGTMLLDKLIIAIFKRTGEIQQRSQLISRLYRLSKKGKVYSVPKRKGFYTTVRPSNHEEAQEQSEEEQS